MGAFSFNCAVGFWVLQIVGFFELGICSAHDEFEKCVEVRFEKFDNLELVEVRKVFLL